MNSHSHTTGLARVLARLIVVGSHVTLDTLSLSRGGLVLTRLTFLTAALFHLAVVLPWA